MFEKEMDRSNLPLLIVYSVFTHKTGLKYWDKAVQWRRALLGSRAERDWAADFHIAENNDVLSNAAALPGIRGHHNSDVQMTITDDLAIIAKAQWS